MARRMHRQRLIVGTPPWAIRMPQSSPVLHVEGARIGVGSAADCAVDFWYEHDDEVIEAERRFLVVGTGHEIPPRARYCGSTARDDDGLVWHLYELPSELAQEAAGEAAG